MQDNTAAPLSGGKGFFSVDGGLKTLLRVSIWLGAALLMCLARFTAEFSYYRILYYQIHHITLCLLCNEICIRYILLYIIVLFSMLRLRPPGVYKIPGQLQQDNGKWCKLQSMTVKRSIAVAGALPELVNSWKASAHLRVSVL